MKHARTTAAALGALCAVAMLWAASAQAALTRDYLGSFGPGGPGAGSFGHVIGVAVDESTEDVYVYDEGEGGRIYKFDAEGKPADFSALGGNAIENITVGYGFGEGAEEVEIAVDNSNGPDKGDIYVTTTFGVRVYSPTGSELGELSGGGYEVCGVATDASGHVYVTLYGFAIKQYVPTTNPFTKADYVSSLFRPEVICNLAVDAEGSVYGSNVGGSAVRKYASSQFNTKGEAPVSTPPGTAFSKAGGTLTAAPTGHQLLIDESTGISEYSDAGTPEPIGHFAFTGAGRLGGSYGVAVNSTTGNPASNHVYAGDGGVVNIYGPPVTIADVAVAAVSNVGKTGVTLNGTVNPRGVPITSCEFEYRIGVNSSSVPCSPAPGSGTSPVLVSAAVEGLSPHTAGEYKLVVVDENGTNISGSASFLTDPAVDGVATAAATEVTGNSATLNGALAPDGLDTHYYFEYGPNTAYGSVSPELPGADAGSASGLQSVSVPVSGLLLSETYHYRLVAVNSLGTTYGEDKAFTTRGAVPTVEAQPPAIDHVTRTTATVLATVDPGGKPTSLEVEYVADGEYQPQAKNPYAKGAASTVVTLEGSREALQRRVGLVGLTAGTVYHYRLVSSNEVGASDGQDHTFTTAAGTPPRVSTGLAGEVTQTGAVLSGVVEAEGLQTSYAFEIGTDTSYAGGKLFGNAGRSAGAEAVSAVLQYLVPGVTYHYRLVATNEDGTTYGQDVSFTTPGVPESLSQPPTAALVPSPAVVFPSISAGSKPSTKPRKTKSRRKHSRKRRVGRGRGKHGRRNP